MPQYPQNYDAFGNIIETPIADANPQDNPGLVYTPNVNPVPPGSLQPGQSIASLVFQSGIAQRRIRITMNPIPAQTNYDPGSTAGAIQIIDSSNNAIWAAGNAAQGGIQFITPDAGNVNSLVILPNPVYPTTSDQLILDIQNTSSTATGISASVAGSGDTIHATHVSGSGSGLPLRVTNTTAVSTHFTPVINSQGVLGGTSTIWQSDGTTPNGNLNGDQGDVCLHGPGGQPFYCSITGSNVWVGM